MSCQLEKLSIKQELKTDICHFSRCLKKYTERIKIAVLL